MNKMTKISTIAVGALVAAASTSALAAEYANVISSTPVIQQVAVPQQVCQDQVQRVQQRPTGAGTVIGGVAGGILGNAVGGGFGRAAATGLGILAGATIGNNVEANAAPAVDVPVRTCQNGTTYESRAVGYDVVYEYNGQRYSTRLASDPGQRLAVDVRPYAQATTPEPAGATMVPTPVPPVTVVGPATYAAPGYYYPAPVYYDSPGYYAGPLIGFGLGVGFGRGWGYHGGYHRWH